MNSARCASALPAKAAFANVFSVCAAFGVVTACFQYGWGVELVGCPTTDQRTLARALVDAGADIVVGGHAHRLLGAGKMGKALVGYGLGNFVWYGTSELSTQTGVLFVTATGRRIDSYRWVPARIRDGVPRPLTGSERSGELRSWHGLRGCTGLKR